jgi:hypothetical protein
MTTFWLTWKPERRKEDRLNRTRITEDRIAEAGTKLMNSGHGTPGTPGSRKVP